MRVRIWIFGALVLFGCAGVPLDMATKTRSSKPASQVLTPVIGPTTTPSPDPQHRRSIPTSEFWAVWHPEFGFLIDGCAGGTWTGAEQVEDWNQERIWTDALVWTSQMEAWAAVDAADIPRTGLSLRYVHYAPSSTDDTEIDGEPRRASRAKLKK